MSLLLLGCGCIVIVQRLPRGGVIDHLDLIGVDLVNFSKTPGFVAFFSLAELALLLGG
jgi:hypothetical protein